MTKSRAALAALAATLTILIAASEAMCSPLVGGVFTVPAEDAIVQQLPVPGDPGAIPRALSPKLGVVMHPLQRVYAPELASQQVQLAQSIGAAIIEIDIHWAWVEPHNPGPAGWDFEQLSWLDNFLSEIDGSGRDVVALVTETPCWASTDPNKDCAARRYDKRFPPRNPRDYADFLTHLVGRYGGRIRYWLIWGEPNTPVRWANPDAGAYTALLKAAYQAIKAADPEAVVISGSLAPRDHEPSVFDYLNEMYAAGAKGYFDILAYNAYTDGNSPTWYHPAFPAVSFSHSVPMIRQIMQAHGDSNPIWLTEVGWSTVPINCEDCWVGTLPNTEAAQAAHMEQAIKIAQSWNYVEAYFAYELVDMIHPPDSRVSVEYHYGLFRKDLTPKPAARRFREMALANRVFLPTIALRVAPADSNSQRARFTPSGIITQSQRPTELSPRAYLPLIIESGVSCFKWHGQTALQDAVNQYSCVEIQAGTWPTTIQISMPAGHTLTGQETDTTVLRAVQPWMGNQQAPGVEAVVHNNGQSNVVIKNLTIDANNTATAGIGAHGRNMTVDSVTVKGAKCNGIAIAAAGWVVQNSLIQGNGFVCPVEPPGSGIYIMRQEYDEGIYRPKILNNRLLDNGGPAIDIDGVQGGLISHNIISNNRAWAAISVNASNWTITENNISHPQGANPRHPGHTECWPTHASILSAGISVCRQPDNDSGGPVQYTKISGNRISSGHGIRLIGDDESDPTWVPEFSTIENNDLSGSIVGCIDDFEPEQSQPGINTWTGNNCAGTFNTPPVYLWRLCPNSVSGATVVGWQGGVAPVDLVQQRIDQFNANLHDGGAFSAGDTIPSGTLVATNFDPQGTGTISWENYPVQTIVRNGSWGIFRAISAYTAPQPGACLLVFP
ncbi:MAG: hypothetical protein BWY63_01682 [Chloroflexi bacterium ADurb.Bin360]|nr:MAG: hypothetical protein BWY63_01682 [Chloroflexi bacterium ADurb.Bin360]